MKNKITAIALLFFIVCFPVYYILLCDWCGGVLFSYFWGLAVMGGGTCFVFRKSRAVGIICGIITLIVLLMSVRYQTFAWIWSAGALVILSAIWLDLKDKKKNNLTALCITAVFLIVAVLGSINTFNSICQMMHFRNISATSVKYIVLQNKERKIIISNPKKQQKILAGLQDSYAYLPNHEGVREPWELTIRLNNKKKITAKVGNSTKAYPDATYIVFSGADYQSRVLHKELQPLLWPAGAKK